MKLKLEIKMDNAAFDEEGGDGWHYEAARILRDAADKIENGESEGNLRDFNGNLVGSFKKVGR